MNHENKHNKVRLIEINENQSGQRIDNYLLKILSGVPKTHIYKIIRKGEVRVNKKRIKPTYKLKIGDVVRVPPVKTTEKMEVKVRQTLIAFLENAIIYEDQQIMVINKPSGLAVHGGSGISYGLIEAVRAMRPDESFLELVHRLDRDTSGCILIAKKRNTLNILHQQLRERQSDKRYLTLLCGTWSGKERKITAPLIKNTLKSGERMVRVDANQGKPSTSVFNPVKVYSQASLIEVKIVTGRTHQIRVHAQHIKMPVAGDEKYGNFACNQRLKEAGLKRLFLHSSQISVQLADDGKLHTFKAPLPDELEKILEQLNESK